MNQGLKRIFTGIGAILLVSGLLRFWGITYGFPYSIGHFDEAFGVRYALAFGATKSLRPSFFYYPAFYFYFLFFLYGVFFVVAKITHVLNSVAEFAFLYLAKPGVFYLIGRIASAFLGSATVGLVYLLAKKAYGKISGISAALLFAFCYTHVYRSHLATPDITMVFLCCLSFVFIYNIFEHGRYKDYLWAGIFAGLATATKYMPIFLFMPILIAHLSSDKNEGQGIIKRLLSAKLISTYCAFALGFLLGSPYWLSDYKSYIQTLSYSSDHVVRFGELWETDGASWIKPIINSVKDEHVLGVCFIAATVFSLFRGKKKHWIFLSFIIAVYLLVARSAVYRTHYLLAAFPFMAVLAGLFLKEMTSRITPHKRAGLVTVLVSLFIIIPSAFKIAKLDYRMTQPDTRIIAKEWIEENIKQGSKIALYTLRYRENPPIVSYGGEFDSIDYGPKAQKTYADSRLAVLLDDYFSNNVTYKIYKLEKELSDEEAKKLLDEKFHDIGYLLNTCKMGWKSINELKVKRVKYLILSSANYERLMRNAAPSEFHPFHKAFLKNKEYFSSLLNSKELLLLKKIVPDKNNLGPVITIFEIK